jgi:hypothetical protein
MNDVQILLDLAKEGHRAEIKAARPAKHDWENCYKCKTILDVDKMVEQAWAQDEMIVLYRP